MCRLDNLWRSVQTFKQEYATLMSTRFPQVSELSPVLFVVCSCLVQCGSSSGRKWGQRATWWHSLLSGGRGWWQHCWRGGSDTSGALFSVGYLRLFTCTRIKNKPWQYNRCLIQSHLFSTQSSTSTIWHFCSRRRRNTVSHLSVFTSKS